MSTLNNSNELELGSEQTTYYLIQQAIEAENGARNIYLKLSQMFTHVPEISSFWQDLADDETKHAEILEKIRRSLSDEQLGSPVDKKLLDGIAKIATRMSEFSLDTIDNLDDAFEIAHEIESSEVNYVFECVVTSDFVNCEDRKQMVSIQIQGHQKKLVDFTENFGNRAWRRQIQVQSGASVSSK